MNLEEEKRRKLQEYSNDKYRKNRETKINCFKNKFSTIIDDSCITSLKRDEKTCKLKNENDKQNNESLFYDQQLQSRNENGKKRNKLIYSHFTRKLNLKYYHPFHDRKPCKIMLKSDDSDEIFKAKKENNFSINDYKTSSVKDRKINNSVKYICLRDDIIDSNKKLGMNRNISS